MGKLIDLTGQSFGNWEVIKYDQSKKGQGSRWWCKCKCGNPEIRSVMGSVLRKGKSKSCGKCNQFEMIGQKFNRLTVLKYNENYTRKKNNGRRYYDVECDCENHTIFTVSGNSLRTGNTKSCGCLNQEIIVQHNKNRAKDITNQIFGYVKALYSTGTSKNNGIIWHCLCLRCGNEFETPIGYLTSKDVQSCGCLISTGEANIQRLFQENNIQFKAQKTFNDLINEKGNKYRYDFYLPEYNRLIEYDGKQHYKYTNHGWNTKENFEKVQQSDKVKNEYALSHNIPLVRIPYWERDNITLDILLGDKYLIKDMNDFGEEEIIL